MKYAVGAGYLTSNIYVGRLGKNSQSFLDKEEATDMVLAAVAEYVMRNFEGGMAATFPRLGLNLEVKVTPLVDAAVSGNEPPPPCLDHREIQHRDGKPPWCDACGWRHEMPARPAMKLGDR
jgi:hypothetical protein